MYELLYGELHVVWWIGVAVGALANLIHLPIRDNVRLPGLVIDLGRLPICAADSPRPLWARGIGQAMASLPADQLSCSASGSIGEACLIGLRRGFTPILVAPHRQYGMSERLDPARGFSSRSTSPEYRGGLAAPGCEPLMLLYVLYCSA